MSRAQLKTRSDIETYLSDYYDIIKWVNEDTLLVHYWDEDYGDYNLEENIYELLDSVCEGD